MYLQSLGYDVWESIKNGYETPTNLLFDIGANKLSDNNSKSMNAILEGLSKSEFTKVTHYKFAKEMWDKLKTTYEGDDKVKQEKLQTHRSQFEILKMNEEKKLQHIFLVWTKF